MDVKGAPRSVGLIMDGNRRWARDRGLPSFEGHRRGVEKLQEIARFAFKSGVHEVIVYAFSTENWKRAEEEVSYLLGLLEEYFEGSLRELIDEGIKIRIIGERERFSSKLQELIRHAEEDSASGETGTLAIALSYGGRREIVNAVNDAVAAGKTLIEESDIAQALWTSDLADPDLIIRTGGEMRLSNFLLWQAAYAELFFTPTLWPDFSFEEFGAILAEYGKRERRMGV